MNIFRLETLLRQAERDGGTNGVINLLRDIDKKKKEDDDIDDDNPSDDESEDSGNDSEEGNDSEGGNNPDDPENNSQETTDRLSADINQDDNLDNNLSKKVSETSNKNSPLKLESREYSTIELENHSKKLASEKVLNERTSNN